MVYALRTLPARTSHAEIVPPVHLNPQLGQ